jgi:tetratricopeptide (TPR) repeat protein
MKIDVNATIILAVIAISLVAVSVLFTSTLAEEDTADYWLKRGDELRGVFLMESYMVNNTTHQLGPENTSAWLEKNEEAVKAYERTLEIVNETLRINPQDARAWRNRGAALASLGQGDAANESYKEASAIYNRSIEENSENASAWWLKAEILETMGKSDAALQAYDKVIELNSSNVLGAWIRKSDIYFSKNEHNESAQAFDRAFDLLSNDASRITSESGLNVTDNQFVSMRSGIYDRKIWSYQRDNHTASSETGWRDGNTTLRINAWWHRGQILRVSFNRYNESSKSYDYYMQIDSNFADYWRNKSLSLQSRLADHQRAIEVVGHYAEVEANFAKAIELGGNST